MIKILIVDDEYIIRQGLRYMISWEEEGYQIVGEASNGSEALELIESLKPHIIICDIVMPIMDGVDFAEIVHKMYPRIPTIILSGYDKFEYVKRACMSGVSDYILKPSLNPEVLRNTLHKAAEQLPQYTMDQKEHAVSYERLLERYMLGHDQELDTKALGKYFQNTYYHIYAVDIKKENAQGKDLSAVLYKKLEREVGAIQDMQSLLVVLREESVCVIFGHEFNQNKKVIKVAEELSEKLSLLCNDILGVCSEEFHQIEEIRSIYQQDIAPNIEKKFYYPEIKMLTVDEKSKVKRYDRMEKFDFMKYSFFLENRKYKEALQLLSDYNEAALKVQVEEVRLKNQIKNMIYCFLDTLSVPDAMKEDYQYEFFKKIGNAACKDEYVNCMREVETRLLELAEMPVQQNDERMNKILGYIEENYKEDLKLDNLADRFNFNYSYLSAYFNQQVKGGFNDYLNRIRITEACRLLKESRHSIARISQEVGYSEHSYFCRVFRKITGKTPSEWRRG